MNMKRLFWKSRIFVRVLSMGIILLASQSCKSHEAVVQSSSAVVQNGSTVVFRTDTVVVRDSVFVSEKQRGDTVYLTRVEWRDRWRTRVERDTVVDVRVEKEVVQLPPERYVPKFYRWCTGLLLAILVLAIGRLALKRWL